MDETPNDDSDAWAAGEAAHDRADEHDEPRVRVADVETTQIDSEPVDPVRPRAADGGDDQHDPDGHGLTADAMREAWGDADQHRREVDAAAAERVAATLRDMGVVVDAEARDNLVRCFVSDRGVNLTNFHGPDAPDRAIVEVAEVGPVEAYQHVDGDEPPAEAAAFFNAFVSHRDQ